jgi:hypothetical protein
MRSLALALAAIGLSGCAAMPAGLAVDTDEATYSALFPYYAEACAVSEIRKKPGFGAEIIAGGPGGHAVLYLNGVCRDRSAGYPTIALCDPGAPGQGVGISANAHYRNANWVATEGRDFFFDGDLPPRERLTRLAYQRAQDKAKAQDVFAGVTFHEENFADMPAGESRPDQPAGESRRDHMYELSIGTDYAIGFARHRYCARVPLERAQMANVVAYLNDANRPYKAGEKIYLWDVIRDNCTHLIHDALAAAGVWRRIQLPDFFLFAAAVFPVPKNEFVNLMRRTNDLPLENPRALYDDDAAREAVLRLGQLPTRPGALASARPVVQDNEIYDTTLSLIVYDEPFVERFTIWFREIFADPRYFDLRANLAHFAARYRAIAERRAPGSDRSPERAHDGSAGSDYAAFEGRFHDVIARERAAVDARLAALGGTPGAPALGARNPDAD